MHHPTDRIAHTTAFVTPVVEHWLELFQEDVYEVVYNVEQVMARLTAEEREGERRHFEQSPRTAVWTPPFSNSWTPPGIPPGQ